MSNSVKPLRDHTNISYRVKCVAVESERIFGNVMISQQNSSFAYHDDVLSNGIASESKKRTCNLIRQTLEGPDFMKLNRILPRQKRNGMFLRSSTSWTLRRSKFVEDRSSIIGVNCDDLGTMQNSELKRCKTYSPPLAITAMNEEAVLTSLVDQLLLDIYGLPGGDRGRSESDSTASSSRLPPQHHHLQRVRLLRKSRTELHVLLENLREHISHAGGLLIRQLRRRDYLLARRDKQYDVVTAHLQARSEKRSKYSRKLKSLEEASSST